MLKKAFVIGDPISHSKSPVIHKFWIAKHHLSATYEAINISPQNLKKIFNEIREDKYIGGNVTLPHKQAAFFLCDLTTPEAKKLGAVNTIYKKNNQIIGHNTDGYGFLANLDQQVPGWDKNIQKTIVLGAGGATRAIILALINRDVSEIVILNRTLKNAENLANQFQKYSKNTKLNTGYIEAFSKHAQDTDFLVNTSSIGLNNTSFVGLDLKLLPETALVHDIVYNPINTPLLCAAKNNNLKTADGLGMLLHQAAPGFEKWFGVFPKVSEELHHLVLNEISTVKTE
ncbi:MAG: shikimate dehydrogenase [Devosiaceae bacterium]|nr:shikimate dehydrogenase [Devosiaceae bacterium]